MFDAPPGAHRRGQAHSYALGHDRQRGRHRAPARTARGRSLHLSEHRLAVEHQAERGSVVRIARRGVHHPRRGRRPHDRPPRGRVAPGARPLLHERGQRRRVAQASARASLHHLLRVLRLPLLLLLDGAHRDHRAPARRLARRLAAHDRRRADLHHWRHARSGAGRAGASRARAAGLEACRRLFDVLPAQFQVPLRRAFGTSCQQSSWPPQPQRPSCTPSHSSVAPPPGAHPACRP